MLERLAPRTTVIAVVAGVALFLPTLSLGFAIDDWMHLARLERVPFTPPAGPLELFRFADGRDLPAGEVQGQSFPWWSTPGLRIWFFRPLSAATHWLDHALWGHEPLPYHVTSLFLWAALVAAAAALSRRLAGLAGRPAGVALLAALVFALDDAHTMTIAWVANRNALVAAVPAALAVLLHLRWRAGGSGLVLAGSLGALGLGLLGGEAALGAAAYIVAWELTGATDRPVARLRAAAPAVALSVAYVVAYAAAGLGASGSMIYLDPLHDPGRVLAEGLGVRFPWLLLGALTPVPADLAGGPEPALLKGPLAWALVAVVAAIVAPVVRRDRVARFAALGAVLSALPLCLTFAGNRLLVLPTIGTSFLVACVIVDFLGAKGRGARAIGWSAVAVHLVLAPLGALAGTQLMGFAARAVERRSREVELPPDLAQARLLLLSAPEPLTGTYAPLVWWADGLGVPKGVWLLSLLPGDQRLTRTGPRSFRLEAPPPGFLTNPWEGLFFDGRILPEGTRRRRGGLEVRVARVEDGAMTAIEVTTDVPLDDPGLWLLAWDGERVARVRPPPEGGCVDLPLVPSPAFLYAPRPRIEPACGRPAWPARLREGPVADDHPAR